MALLDSMNLRNASAHALRSGVSVEHHEVGRVCDAPECTTKLSRYNPAATCSAHKGWTDAPRRRESAAS
jgi:hypothetical protein